MLSHTFTRIIEKRVTFLEKFNYIPKYNLSDLNDFLNSNQEFYVFGADYEGEYCLEWLIKNKKHVISFIDNNPNKVGTLLSNLEIKSLDTITDMNSRFIIASIHSDQIAKQLEDHGYKLFEHYIAYDNLYWINKTQFSDCVGNRFYQSFVQHKDNYSKVIELLADDFSKEVYCRVINYRLTSLVPTDRGKEFLPIPFEVHKKRGREIQQIKEILSMNLKGHYSDKEMKMLISSIANFPYKYLDVIKNENLEVVIDAGGFIGDTAIAFAFKNPNGKVYSFEPSKLGIENMVHLTQSFPNIIPIQMGLWYENCLLAFNEEDELSNSSRVNEGQKVIDAITLDSFVQDRNIIKVDFIKMDIEGAELNALKGAKSTILRDKPDLAICIYHSPTDLWEIPLWIKNNFPDYHIYIDHTDGMFVYGTVCFATVKSINVT